MSNLLSVMAARAQQLARSRAAAWGRRAVAVAPGPALGLALLALAAYAGYFTYYALSGLDLVGLLRDVNNDDAFYYYQIARNLAEGQFSTFDGGITRTNGYHPAWMLLITPFYWVLDRETALFGIKAFELCLIGGSVVVLVAAARLCRLPWLALFAIIPLLYQQRALWAGLEAAAGLLALSLLFLSLSLMARQPGRYWPLLAAAAFILPWVRLEYLAISLTATVGAAVVVGMQSKPDADVDTDAGEARRLVMGRFRIGLPPWCVVGPLLGACGGGVIYFVYNRLVFGGYVPVSGAFKALWSQTKFAEDGGYSLMQNVLAHGQHSAFRDGLLAAVEVGIYALLVWWVGRRASQPRPQLLPIFLVGAAALAVGHAAKFVQHALAIHPFYNEGWYFVPAYLLTALLIPIRCFMAVYLINALVNPRWPNIGRVLTRATVGATVIVLAATVDFMKPFEFVDSISRHTHEEINISGYLGTQVMNRVLPDDAVVGSWDSGIIGYFADFPVVNLDGLANSYDHYRNYEERRYGITHYANNTMRNTQQASTLFEGVGFTTPEPGPTTSPDDRNLIQLKFKLWRPNYAVMAAGPAPVERLRAALQEQGDYYSDGTAALVSANLVQTFDFNCASRSPEAWLIAVAEQFPDGVGNGDDDKLMYFWGDLSRNNLGHCVAAFELPNDTAHPVSVTMQPFAAAINALLPGLTPILQSEWAVYRSGRQLLYHRAPCAPADTAAQFYLKLIPANDNDLASWQREGSYISRDFEFKAADGVRYAGHCAVTALLPDYALSGIRTGQFMPATGLLWGGEFYTTEYLAAQASALAASVAGAPAAPNYFNVYHDHDAGTLTYLREECARADTEAGFYLHLAPADLADLPAERREHWFDNHDFNFGWMGGVRHAGRCLVSIPLPDYAIAHIRTGQHTPDAGALWSGEFYTETYQAARAAELAAQAVGEPVMPGFYNVYYDDGTLTYVRENCTPADTAAAFYLHLVPADAAVLPEGQREHGFDNRDFEFGAAGGVQSAGRCLVSVELPDYAIDRIRTGQYTPDGGRLWAVEFEVE